MNVDDINRIAIVGAGLMGHGIAQEFALAGYEVHLHDLSEDRLQTATRDIRANLQRLAGSHSAGETQAESVLKKIHPSTVLREVVAEVDVVIEAVFENLELKQDIFRELDQLCPAHTILASNTSTLLPSKLAAATQRPEKVLVAHYWNPPYLLPIVEIVRGDQTSDETVSTIYDLLRKVGKRPAIVQKEIPGFIGNRLQMALLREALSIVEQGAATAQDVDIVIKNGFGRRLAAAGVFEVFEIAGWDLISQVLSNVLSDIESSSELPGLLREKLQRDELGMKSGKGFYEWTPESAETLKQRIAQALVEIAKFP